MLQTTARRQLTLSVVKAGMQSTLNRADAGQRSIRLSDEEFSRRYRLAIDEQQRTLAPYVKWLTDTELMMGKSTLILKPGGTMERTVEYPSEVQVAIDKMKAMMKQVQSAIWAYRLPGCAPTEEADAGAR